jgi:hypothetical protein
VPKSSDRDELIRAAVRDAAVRSGLIDIALCAHVDHRGIHVDDRGEVAGAVLAMRELRDRQPAWFLDSPEKLLGE